MNVNRRSAIKQFVFASAGVILIPSCFEETKRKASILLQHIAIAGEQEKLLEELTDTLIPATATPGAKDAGAHLFALNMIDDCFTKVEQGKFVTGLNEFEKMIQKNYGKSFMHCTPAERTSVLTMLETNKSVGDELAFFYSTFKRLTIQAYLTSKYYLTKVEVYELVPARFNGCVPVKAVVNT